jgi:hypothetical protein
MAEMLQMNRGGKGPVENAVRVQYVPRLLYSQQSPDCFFLRSPNIYFRFAIAARPLNFEAISKFGWYRERWTGPTEFWTRKLWFDARWVRDIQQGSHRACLVGFWSLCFSYSTTSLPLWHTLIMHADRHPTWLIRICKASVDSRLLSAFCNRDTVAICKDHA